MVMRFFCPPETPRSIWLPTSVSEHTCTRSCSSQGQRSDLTPSFPEAQAVKNLHLVAVGGAVAATWLRQAVAATWLCQAACKAAADAKLTQQSTTSDRHP